MFSKYKITIVSIILVTFLGACSKVVQVPEPQNTITTEETFSSDASATSATVGLYIDVLTGAGGNGYALSYGDGLMTIDPGMSADELMLFGNTSPFQTMALNSSNNDVTNSFWNGPYFDIYLANSIIEGVQSSVGVTAATRNQLTGEAEFFRAFCHFYLVNLFGAIPLVTTTAYATNDTLSRTPIPKVYQQIIADLQSAERLLPPDYSISQGQRVRVNKYCAAALLARVYLFTDSFPSAEAAATTVINSTNLYTLESNPNNTFQDTSSEAILQWLPIDVYPYATEEGYTILPAAGVPNYYLTTQLLASFEPGDLRWSSWVDSVEYSGTEYYYPYKYKINVGSGGNPTEYYTVLRLAEQYLIRAEARAEQNNLLGAIADLNVIRSRANLAPLSGTLGQAQVLAAVYQERKIELFCEWGHRWFDLKRTGQATTVLTADKGFTVTGNQLLYPIPASELVNDASLVQNNGY